MTQIPPPPEKRKAKRIFRLTFTPKSDQKNSRNNSIVEGVKADSPSPVFGYVPFVSNVGGGGLF